MKWRLTTVTLAAAALLVGCGASGHDIKGSFVLTDPGVTNSGVYCSGTGGYSDIAEGLGVTVKDDAGKIIGTSQLSGNVQESSGSTCSYTFAVHVPDSDFYSIEVGHRGALTYSRDELEGRKWEVGFTLGN